MRACDGTYWRICPEELSCVRIARSEPEYAQLAGDEEFVSDWEMVKLVELAREKLGPLSLGHWYCLKMPAVLGGGYEAQKTRKEAGERDAHACQSDAP